MSLKTTEYPYPFVPITLDECKKLGFNRCDIIFVTGDTYIDSPFVGVALLARLLEFKGYKVGIIPQPDINNLSDITRLGEPKLFWGVTAGSIDSMVANYTAILKKRKSDDLTPGGINNRRPDRATIVYSNLIRRAYKETTPIIIGGVEASTRRIAHYDYWDDKIRRSILFDSKADLLMYGMAEITLLEVANILNLSYKEYFEENLNLQNENNENAENKDKIKREINQYLKIKLKEKIKKINGLCYIDNQKPIESIEIPSYEQVIEDKKSYEKSQLDFFEYINKFEIIDEANKKPLVQRHNDRYLIHNPPNSQLNQEWLDQIYELGFNHDAHPLLKKKGKIVALDTIPFSVTSHRGCFGGCNFCSIAIHQGKKVVSRSNSSIIKEISGFNRLKHFNGIIKDIGGPTANMFEIRCKKFKYAGSCARQSCLFPAPCEFLEIDHGKYLRLLNEIKKIPYVKKVFVSSGIRYDLILLDKSNGENFLTNLIKDFTSGQFKIAPEHTEDKILKLMGKPSNSIFKKFLSLYINISNKLSLSSKKDNSYDSKTLYFDRRIDKLKINKKEKSNLNKFISLYLIASYPGCKIEDMAKMKNELDKYYFIEDSQVQIFTPLPLTYAALQYYLEKDPKTNEKLFVEKNLKKKKEQKDIIFF